jgi:oligopeptide transport system permease protein
MLYWSLVVLGLLGVVTPRRRRGSASLRRVGEVLLTVAAVHAATHWVMLAAPGSPFDGDVRLDPQLRERIEASARRGTDTVAGSFSALWSGDGAPSLALRDYSASEVLREGARRSVSLGVRALVTAILVGGLVGIVAGLRGGWFDHATRLATAVIPALPVFGVAAGLVMIFAGVLGWAPPASLDGRPPHLPVLTAAAAPAAMIARLIRDEIRRNREAGFARAAAARGARPLRRLFVHLLPQSLIPAVSYLGPAAASLLTGTLAVEAVFGIPGLGTHLVQGALARDLPVVCGATTLYAAALGAFGLAADAVVERLDPRRSAS